MDINISLEHGITNQSLFTKGTSGFDKAMYAYGMVGLGVDYQEGKQYDKNKKFDKEISELKAKKDYKALNEKVKEFRQESKTFWHNWLGPNGNANPNFIIQEAPDLLPDGSLDWDSFYHDVDFFKKGGSGPMSAFFGRNQLNADSRLASSGWYSMTRSDFGGSFGWSAGVGIVFTATSYLKTQSLYGKIIR